ncbi:lyase family protein [Corynebacterium pyruviciproducens]|uniref:lyase family protein n=1 Tax=Corynebacterium pyruviciproducens TaxID=598660 RepID=UPI0023F35C79|nr:lyase family protein [Corynebacterium pyruviciproducens]
MRAPFNLLYQNAGNETQLTMWSEGATIEAWLATERALALSQGELGVIDHADAEAIATAAVLDNIDHAELWKVGKNVGYPILGLVRQISAHLPEGPDGRVHYGATTQDIMDTGLVLQMTSSLRALDAQLERFGAGLATKAAAQYKFTVMAGRTHAQQAVPTTYGATLAALLDEVRRQRARLQETYERIRLVSLWGAGGTNAAQGPKSAETRKLVAEKLGLKDPVVPWHTKSFERIFHGWCNTFSFTRDVISVSR